MVTITVIRDGFAGLAGAIDLADLTARRHWTRPLVEGPSVSQILSRLRLMTR
jgi:hypothetical protein